MHICYWWRDRMGLTTDRGHIGKVPHEQYDNAQLIKQCAKQLHASLLVFGLGKEYLKK